MGILKSIRRFFKMGKIHFDTTDVHTSTDIRMSRDVDLIGSCSVDDYPGCCGIGVLTGVKIFQGNLNKGYGTLLVEKAIEVAKEKEFSLLVATTNQHTPNMQHILKKKGFVELDITFKNKKTNNTIYQYQLVLNNEN